MKLPRERSMQLTCTYCCRPYHLSTERGEKGMDSGQTTEVLRNQMAFLEIFDFYLRPGLIMNAIRQEAAK